ncbi:hypothetical protein COU15_02860 [Candidatus Kaiserbacteria bacterium CG10_big_fil_rev_8_21_14_0_10_45_20]|uniref:HTH deoR-type domain-containing protein n=1 Tax=Candidatus Kaiserbacteria bacterium CG10_big_fil_rev_8_21_14_0_10_45_20 TaxID=1974607 RepID=A0A2H0UF05_9BACT|nr:MAG: hypothetical protein COU15_02860 [Candidatus Kaiserbacteria bacterium CG10_big_fil_rev_8_21_14_0_10_45_20]
MSYSNKSKKDISLSKNNVSFYNALGQFLKNDHHNFVVQKSEKLASALYIVTGFIGEDDPLRKRLRTCAIDLVSASMKPQKTSSSDSHRDYFASQCMEISTMLNLAEKAGVVSPMNAKILCDEYGSLASFVTTHHDKVFHTAQLDKDSTKTKVRPSLSYKTDKSKGHTGSTIKDTMQNVRESPVSDKREERRRKIMEVLDIKDKINISDATNAVPEYSEKTVQRELTDLVREGALIKEGERRWSTYKKAF